MDKRTVTILFRFDSSLHNDWLQTYLREMFSILLCMYDIVAHVRSSEYARIAKLYQPCTNFRKHFTVTLINIFLIDLIMIVQLSGNNLEVSKYLLFIIFRKF